MVRAPRLASGRILCLCWAATVLRRIRFVARGLMAARKRARHPWPLAGLGPTRWSACDERSARPWRTGGGRTRGRMAPPFIRCCVAAGCAGPAIVAFDRVHARADDAVDRSLWPRRSGNGGAALRPCWSGTAAWARAAWTPDAAVYPVPGAQRSLRPGDGAGSRRGRIWRG